MSLEYTEIRVNGRTIKVPSVRIGDRKITIEGNWLRTATIHDEELIEGEAVDSPERLINELKQRARKADIFTFAQHLPNVTPKYQYHLEWDNVAAIRVISFADWWNKRISDLRKDVRRSQKRGVVVRAVKFADEFVRGIMEIYNETPVRQGRHFWHYGKDFDTVKAESSTYLDRSEFLGAYYGGELVGFLKIVYVARIARLMFIISKIAHHDKRPTNGLIAKAVELCAERKCSYLTYGNYTYGNNANSSLIAFKHRNGFEQVLFPRYFIPLTLKGELCLKLRLHHGIKKLIPEKVLSLARNARAKLYESLAPTLESTRRRSTKNRGEIYEKQSESKTI
jgi:hypothetical protein